LTKDTNEDIIKIGIQNKEIDKFDLSKIKFNPNKTHIKSNKKYNLIPIVPIQLQVEDKESDDNTNINVKNQQLKIDVFSSVIPLENTQKILNDSFTREFDNEISNINNL